MITCKMCILTRGFSLADKDRMFDTEEQLFDHIENEHGIPVMREGETKEQAIARCAEKGIVSDRSECTCKDCERLREQEKKLDDRKRFYYR